MVWSGVPNCISCFFAGQSTPKKKEITDSGRIAKALLANTDAVNAMAILDIPPHIGERCRIIDESADAVECGCKR